jgi:boron transporter
MINDVRRRLPFYWSDWRDAWDYRVVPATVYMYFAKYVFNVIYLLLKTWWGFERWCWFSGQHITCFGFLVRYVSLKIWWRRGNADEDRFTKTNMSYGVNEVLLASVLGSVVFAVFAAQPLVIVGVTGPITVFN